MTEPRGSLHPFMLKRFLVLACALVLFVTGFFIHQWWTDAKIEGQFRAERNKFHVEGQDLVTINPPASEPLTPTAPPIPVVSTGAGDATVPAAIPATAPTGPAPSAQVPLDSNTLIGPMPPPAAPASNPGDTNAPATPATNSPDSTFVYPGLRQLPLVLLGSYQVTRPRLQDTGAAPTAPLVVPAPSPASNAPAALPATNTISSTESKAPVAATNAATSAEPISEGHGANVASSVIILGFHQFTPPGVRAGGKAIYTMPEDVFETEMKYLKDNHYNVVPLSDVVAFAKHQKQLPLNTVAVTIDDGYKSAIVHAAPILKKYGFPWTFFVYPAFITRTESKGAASWPDLVELEKEGVDVECHSMTHPQLAHHGHKTPEEYDAWLTNETVNSKAIIEKELNKTVKYFAYPYGEYDKIVEAKTIAAGYEAIFTVANNPIHPGTNVYAMGRYIITTPVEKSYVAYLRQGALALANVSPAPGATVTDPRPTISAVLGYAGKIDPKSLIAEVSGMGEVRYDFDPKSLALRLYLPRDLIAPVAIVNVHAKDADTGQTMVASWHFNYQATAAGVAHKPIGTARKTKTSVSTATNEPVTARSPRKTEILSSSSNAVSEPASNAAPSEVKESLATPPPGASTPASTSNAVPAVPAEAASATNASPSAP